MESGWWRFIRGGLALAALIVSGCAMAPEHVADSRGKPAPALMPGDLVFRTLQRRYLPSRLERFKNLRDHRFSHAGIISQVDPRGKATVAHVHPKANSGRAGELSLRWFLRDSNEWAAYRPNGGSAPQREAVAAAIRDSIAAGIPFDRKFDLGDSRAQYCTEFIWRVWKDGGGIDLVPQPPRLLGRPYLPLDIFYGDDSRVTKVFDSAADSP